MSYSEALEKAGANEIGYRFTAMENRMGTNLATLTGSFLVHSNSRNVCLAIQRGIEKRYSLRSHVVKRGTKWQVRIDSPMKRVDGYLANAYASAVIDVCAEFKLDRDRL